MAAITGRPASPQKLHGKHSPQDAAENFSHSAGNGVAMAKLSTDRVLQPRINANQHRTDLLRKDPVLEKAFRILNNLPDPGDGEASQPLNKASARSIPGPEEGPEEVQTRETAASEAPGPHRKAVSHTKEDIRRVKRITEAVAGPDSTADQAPAALSDAIYAWEEELEMAGLDNDEFPPVLSQLRALSKEANARSSLNSSVAEHADVSAVAVKTRVAAGLTQIRRALVRQACEAAVASAARAVAQQGGRGTGRRLLSRSRGLSQQQSDEGGSLPRASASPPGARRHTLGALAPVQQTSPELPTVTDATSPTSPAAFDGLPGAFSSSSSSSSALVPQGGQQPPPVPHRTSRGASRKLQPQCIQEQQQLPREQESPFLLPEAVPVRMWDNGLEEEGDRGDEEESGWPSRERLSGASGSPWAPLTWVNPVADRSRSPGSSRRRQVPLAGLEERFSNPLAEEEGHECDESRWRGATEGGSRAPSGSLSAHQKQKKLMDAVAAENAAVRRILSWFLSGGQQQQQQQQQQQEEEEPQDGSSISNSSSNGGGGGSSPYELLQWLSGATGRPLPQVCAELGTSAAAAADGRQEQGREGPGSCCSSSVRRGDEEDEEGACPGLRQMRPARLELELVRLIKHLSSAPVVTAAENCK